MVAELEMTILTTQWVLVNTLPFNACHGKEVWKCLLTSMCIMSLG
jgi:hypothetical protein